MTRLRTLLDLHADELAEEFGPVERVIPQDDGTLLVTTEHGATLRLSLDSPHADARLCVEVVA